MHQDGISKLNAMPDLEGHASEIKLWFKREDPSSTPIGYEKKSFRFLCAKQVPSVLSLAGISDPNLRIEDTRNAIVDQGIPLIAIDRREKEKGFFPLTVQEDLLDSSEIKSGILSYLSDESSTASSRVFKPKFHLRDDIKIDNNLIIKIDYQDPWENMMSMVYSSARGLSQPYIRIWPGTTARLSDPLPKHSLPESFRKSINSQIEFTDISDPDVKMFVIRNHTYWGRKLQKWKFDGTFKKKTFAKDLIRRLKAFLKGKPHPQWKDVGKYYSDPEMFRDMKTRSYRLLELLRTIEGIFLQRFAFLPEEKWTWEKFDKFNLWNLSYFLDDEFLDGKLTEYSLSLTTRYQKLKQLRKRMKMYLLQGKPSMVFEDYVPDKPLLWFKDLLRFLQPFGSTRYAYQTSVLSQTRGCGQPPPLFCLQSKLKFTKVVTEVPTPLNDTQKGLLRACLDSLLEKIPKATYTGLDTKGRVTISNAACWEKTRAEGGTIQAISELMVEGKQGKPVAIYDLDTMNKVTHKHLYEMTEGEYIFWSSFQKVITSKPEDLTRAFLSIVKEPGKARSVTKASAYLKVILDFVGKICAWPLKRLESSESGMSRDAHGWNLFRSFFYESNRDILFQPRKPPEIDNSVFGVLKETVEYSPVFVLSYDCETATDFMQHDFAEIIAEFWMTQCGIPKVLKGIVHRTSFRPRDVYFYADGGMEKIGQPTEFEGVRKVRLVRGVLMGDPITKPVLHLFNALNREMANIRNRSDILARYFTNPIGMAKALEPIPWGTAQEDADQEFLDGFT
jgi:hypothetical protein